jgi:Leucine-rich repeat (LRR) protein
VYRVTMIEGEDGGMGTDVTQLARLRYLSECRIGMTGKIGLAPLGGLTRLEDVCLEGSGITDITPLAKCRELTSLSLSHTGVADVSPLAGLTKLEHLYLSSTLVKDVAPLKGLKSLRELSLPEGTVTEEQVKELQHELPRCHIEHE